MARAFLITPFTPERAGNESPEAFGRVQEAIAEAAARTGVELVHPARMSEPGFIMEQVDAEIEEADVVVAIITGQNPNVFFELGRARRPAILICRSEADVPFDIRHLRYWTYGGAGELDTLPDRLEAAISATLQRRERSAEERRPAGELPDVLRHDPPTGFAGVTERGPRHAVLVQSMEEYRAEYGELVSPEVSYLGVALQGFFANGGRRAVTVRVLPPDARSAGMSIRFEDGTSLAIWARSEGAWGNRIEVRLRPGTRVGVRLTVTCHPGPAGAEPEIEDYDNSSVEADGPNPLHERVNERSNLIRIRYDALQLPAEANWSLVGGTDGTAPAPEDYEQTGLARLEALDEVDLVCVPDHVHPSLTLEQQGRLTDLIVASCERRGDRLALLTTPAGQHEPDLLKPRHDTAFAAVYYPWVQSAEAETLIPPIGHIAGAFARHDMAVGVHQAPLDLCLRGTGPRGLDPAAPADVADRLGRIGVNLLSLSGEAGEPCLPTAYTLAIDERLRYVNVTRFGCFLRRTLAAGLAWTAFEVNAEPLWAKVRAQLRDFFEQLQAAGVLLGAKPEEAFFVRCDASTMTPDDVANGRLIIVCGAMLTGPPVAVPASVELSVRPGSPSTGDLNSTPEEWVP